MAELLIWIAIGALGYFLYSPNVGFWILAYSVIALGVHICNRLKT